MFGKFSEIAHVSLYKLYKLLCTGRMHQVL